ncbi:hypothetical protein FXF09_17185, partial [Vibrio cholerae]
MFPTSISCGSRNWNTTCPVPSLEFFKARSVNKGEPSKVVSSLYTLTSLPLLLIKLPTTFAKFISFSFRANARLRGWQRITLNLNTTTATTAA